MSELKLFLIVLGGRPKGRNVEQHDVIFAVSDSIENTYVKIKDFWDINVHIDSYCEINEVDGFNVRISKNKEDKNTDLKLFFLNLGGYKPDDLEEYHKKLVIAAKTLLEAKNISMKDKFFDEGIQDNPKACTHLDDQFIIEGFDIDDSLIIDEQIEPEYFIVLKENKDARFDNNKKYPGYRVLK